MRSSGTPARLLTVLGTFAIVLGACSAETVGPTDPRSPAIAASGPAAAPLLLRGPDASACWGQATKVFAAMGVMGEHASEQETPRVGLRNLARSLYSAGVLPEDTLQALGAFVAATLGLSIDACL